MTEITDTVTVALLAAGAGGDPIGDRLRQNIRSTIEAVFEEELAAFIGRCRYGRDGGAEKGYRPGSIKAASRPLLVGTFGRETVHLPQVRVADDAGKTTEWRSKGLGVISS